MTDNIKKMGRPTTDPKTLKVTVRFNNEQSEKIKKHAKKHKITVSDVLRHAVDGLPDK